MASGLVSIEDSHLLFRLLAQADLRVAFGEVLDQVAPALVQGGNEEACHGVARHRRPRARSAAPGANLSGSKISRKKPQRGGHDKNLPRVERGAPPAEWGRGKGSRWRHLEIANPPTRWRRSTAPRPRRP